MVDRGYDGGYRSRLSNLTRFSVVAILVAIFSFFCGQSTRLSGSSLPVLKEIPLNRILPIVQCSDLPEPLGGNNRSILSAGADRDALDVNISLDKAAYFVGENIEISVTYYNRANGPIVIYHNEDILPPISLNEGFSGLIDQSGHPPAPIPFPSRYLRLLGSRARCSEDYTLAGDRLQLAGLTPGEYRIRAGYNNPNPGVRPAEELNPPFPEPTPFPEYRADQNVWVGRGSSNEVRITITG